MTAADPWWDRAACAGQHRLFDPAEGEIGRGARRAVQRRHAKAAKVCARCPVLDECAADVRPGRDEGFRAGRVLPPIHKQPPRRRSA